MMKEAVFDLKDEALIEDAIRRFEEKGWKVACTSNLNVPENCIRITWLPKSCFTEEKPTTDSMANSLEK